MRHMPFSDDLSSPTIGLKQPFAQDSTALRIDDHASSKSRRQHSARDYFDASLQSMPLVQVEMLSRIESLVWANIDLLSMIEWRALRAQNSEKSSDGFEGVPDFVHRFESSDPTSPNPTLRLL